MLLTLYQTIFNVFILLLTFLNVLFLLLIALKLKKLRNDVKISRKFNGLMRFEF